MDGTKGAEVVGGGDAEAAIVGRVEWREGVGNSPGERGG